MRRMMMEQMMQHRHWMAPAPPAKKPVKSRRRNKSRPTPVRNGATMKRWVFQAILLSLPWMAHAESAPQREYTRTLALTPDEVHGAVLFEQCASCHGPDGGGTTNGSIPRIAGQHYRVLVGQILDFRRGKRWDMRMEGVATSHEVIPELQDVADVAAFISHLARDGQRGVGDGQYVEQGQAIYSRSCASCHGADAAGNAQRGIPQLAGQHAAYLSRQIYDAVDGRRPALAASHRKWLAKLDFQQVQGLADYLSRLGWQGGAEARQPRSRRQARTVVSPGARASTVSRRFCARSIMRWLSASTRP
jgi:cytochrome c553